MTPPIANTPKVIMAQASAGATSATAARSLSRVATSAHTEARVPQASAAATKATAEMSPSEEAQMLPHKVAKRLPA